MEIYKLVQPNVVLNNKIMFSEKKINNENIKMSFLVFILFSSLHQKFLWLHLLDF